MDSKILWGLFAAKGQLKHSSRMAYNYEDNYVILTSNWLELKDFTNLKIVDRLDFQNFMHETFLMQSQL